MIITLESLYKDHDNLRRVLSLLEQLFIDLYRGHSQDLPMLQRILVYIQDYPDRVHHPAEDAMFSVILNGGACSRKFREDIHKIMKDHSEIEGITRNALEAVESTLITSNPDITDIGTSISTLISRQSAHLLFEEMCIYPQISTYLDNEDWEKVSALFADDEDPVFGIDVKAGYEQIFKALDILDSPASS